MFILNLHHHPSFSYLHDLHEPFHQRLTGVEINRWRVQPMVKFHHKNQLNFYLVVNTSRFKALNNDLSTSFWCDVVIKSCIPFRWQWFDYGALKLNTTVLLLCASIKMIDKLLGVPLTKLLIFYILFAMIIDWNKCVMLLGTLTKKVLLFLAEL